MSELGRLLRVLSGLDRAYAQLTSRVRPTMTLQVCLLVIIWPAGANGRNKTSPLERLLAASAA
jgi:hypothetical protein